MVYSDIEHIRNRRISQVEGSGQGTHASTQNANINLSSFLKFRNLRVKFLYYYEYQWRVKFENRNLLLEHMTFFFSAWQLETTGERKMPGSKCDDLDRRDNCKSMGLSRSLTIRVRTGKRDGRQRSGGSFDLSPTSVRRTRAPNTHRKKPI
jgi:hypothetical protein